MSSPVLSVISLWVGLALVVVALFTLGGAVVGGVGLGLYGLLAAASGYSGLRVGREARR